MGHYPARARLRHVLEPLGLLNIAREMRDSLVSVREVRNNWRYWVNGAGDGLPVPPLRLVRSATGTSSLTWAFRGGALAAQSLIDALLAQRRHIDDFERILDFGCGFGRVIRHWAPLRAEVHGCDYNRQAIEWCRRNLTFATFAFNRLRPPLPYADACFDLVYAFSVFTHFPESLFRAWRDELTRVLKPGGLAIISTHGEAYLNDLTPDEQEHFRSGLLVVRHANEAGTNRCGVYISEDGVRKMFADPLAIIRFIPQGATGNPHQDLVVLQKVTSSQIGR